MSSTVTQETEVLRALDSDLPYLASCAAIELDNVLLGNQTSLVAVKSLAERLRNATAPVEGGEAPKSLMDTPTLQVFTRAVNDSGQMGVTTLGDLTLVASRIAGTLAGATPDSNADRIRQMREFCVALSRAAAAFRQSSF